MSLPNPQQHPGYVKIAPVKPPDSACHEDIKDLPECVLRMKTSFGVLIKLTNRANNLQAVAECRRLGGILAPMTFEMVEEVKDFFPCCRSNDYRRQFHENKPWRIGLELYNGGGWWTDGRPYDQEYDGKHFVESTGPSELEPCQEAYFWPAAHRSFQNGQFWVTEKCGKDAPSLCLETAKIAPAVKFVDEIVKYNYTIIPYPDATLYYSEIAIIILLMLVIIYLLLQNWHLRVVVGDAKEMVVSENKSKEENTYEGSKSDYSGSSRSSSVIPAPKKVSARKKVSIPKDRMASSKHEASSSSKVSSSKDAESSERRSLSKDRMASSKHKASSSSKVSSSKDAESSERRSLSKDEASSSSAMSS